MPIGGIAASTNASTGPPPAPAAGPRTVGTPWVRANQSTPVSHSRNDLLIHDGPTLVFDDHVEPNIPGPKSDSNFVTHLFHSMFGVHWGWFFGLGGYDDVVA